MRFSLLLAFAAVLAPAQIVSFGLKAGVPATSSLPSYYSNNYGSLVDTGRWTVGPTVEVRLPYGFSVEGDALYRTYRQLQSIGIGGAVFNGATLLPAFEVFHHDTKVWDFPVLLKYRFNARRFRPFVDAGYSWTHESSDVTFSYACLATASECAAAGPPSQSSQLRRFDATNERHGPVGGLGIEFKVGRIKISPEVRYTRLNNPNANHGTVMVGFTF